MTFFPIILRTQPVFNVTNATLIKNIKILVGNSLTKRDITLVTDTKGAPKPINGRHLSGYEL
jgi:hypothetical protein